MTIVMPRRGVTMAATTADIIMADTATMVVTITTDIAAAEGASSAVARSWVVDRAVIAACLAVGIRLADCHRLRRAAFHLHGQARETAMEDHERIRQRAQIWECEGWPDGRHEQHWAQARQEIAAETSSPTAPGDSPTPMAPDHGGSTPGESVAAAAAVNAPRKAEVGPEPKAGGGGSGERGQNSGRMAGQPRGR